MEGKTQGKDIMLLCKGWYNKDKYKTLKDALKAYYHKYYDNEDIDPDYGFIDRVLLKPAIQELLTDRFKHLFVSCLFDTDGFDIWKFDKMMIKELSYEEELYYRLTKFLHGLRRYENDNTELIDTNDYWLIVDGHKALHEDII